MRIITQRLIFIIRMNKDFCLVDSEPTILKDILASLRTTTWLQPTFTIGLPVPEMLIMTGKGWFYTTRELCPSFLSSLARSGHKRLNIEFTLAINDLSSPSLRGWRHHTPLQISQVLYLRLFWQSHTLWSRCCNQNILIQQGNKVWYNIIWFLQIFSHPSCHNNSRFR